MAGREHNVVFWADGLKKTYRTAMQALRGVAMQYKADESRVIAGVSAADEVAAAE